MIKKSRLGNEHYVDCFVLDPHFISSDSSYLLFAVTKTLGKIIYDQPYNYLNGSDLLTNCQSDFRFLHSTLTVLLETSNNWCVNVDKGLLDYLTQ